MPMNFGQRVDSELASRGLTRKALTSDLRIAPNSVALWVKFARVPGADIAVAVARWLGVSVEFLVTGEDMGTDPWLVEHAAVISVLRALPDEVLQEVLAYARFRAGRTPD